MVRTDRSREGTTMTQPRKELTLSRVVKAPRGIAFRAWTEPDLLVQWWGPDGVSNCECEIEPRAGGVFRVVMVAGETLGDRSGERWPVIGTIQEFDPPARLVIATQAVDDDGTVHLDAVTTVLFDDEGDGTTRITVHTAAEGISVHAPQMLEGMRQGWTESMDKFAAFVPDAAEAATPG